MCVWTVSIVTCYTNTTFRKQTLAYEFVGIWFFWIVTYSQDCSAPENQNSLLSKRRVCVISDDGQSPNTHQ